MSTIVKLPDGSERTFDSPVTALAVAQSISQGLARAALAAVVDGKSVDLDTPIGEGTHELKILTDRDGQSLEVLRHTAAHVMAQAVVQLFGPEAKYTIGPALMDDFQYGFYYDFDLPRPVTAEDLAKIEAQMKQIVSAKTPLHRQELTTDQAKELFADLGQDYKIEMIDDLARDEHVASVSLYRQGDFLDLCRGPHLPHTGKVGKAFKLLSTAGAYWRGDEKNKMLTRIYGIAFFDAAALEAHLARVEEARKRDHRVLGKQLGLFHFSDKVGPGLPLWLPKGTIIRMELEGWLRGELLKRGYQPVITPHIGKIDLWRTSGHYPYYEHGLFPTMVPARTQQGKELLDALVDLLNDKGETAAEPLAQERELVEAAGIDASRYPWGAVAWERLAKARYLCQTRDAQGREDGMLLKPMNCPFHIQIYGCQQRSYRDLPLRLSEFGTVYRFEQSGELSGLTRVRGFTQDDAHIFCTAEQLEAEIESCVDLTRLCLATLGLNDYRVRIGLRDPDDAKYTGSAEHWDRAEQNIRNVVTKLGMNFTEERGEAAFYGPKIDFVVKDCIGREWQLGTIQVDYNLPQRFELSYIGPDNAPHRPVMIHRAPLGSPERFIGILIEHFAGAFPLWLSPVQVAVLSVSERFNAYAAEVAQALKQAGIRTQVDDSPEKIGAKIRTATLDKVPYMAVIGEREQSAGSVAVRHRTRGDIAALTVGEFVAAMREEIDAKGPTTRLGIDP
ncbi:MAG: threonine--tRNA ligase [Phycisphaerae bacterium]